MISARDIDYAAVAHLARCVRLTTRNGWRDSFTVDATPETDALTDPELIAVCGLGDVPFGGSVKRGDPHRVDVYTD